MNPMHDPRGYSLNGVNRTPLGALFLLWLFDRLKCGICGPNPLPPRSLKTAVQVIDPGYCLDAPEAMPAGGMTNFSLPPDGTDDPPMWLAEQMLCERG